MEVKMSEKMKTFVNGYKRLEKTGVKKLKDIFAPNNKPNILKDGDNFLYMHEFENLKIREHKFFKAPNKAYLYQKFDVVNKTTQVEDIIQGEYTIGAISRITQMGELNIFYEVETTLFVLSKYGIFEIAKYNHKLPDKYDEYFAIVKEAYKGVKITILPIKDGEFAKEFDKHLNEIVKKNINAEGYDLNFEYTYLDFNHEKLRASNIPISSSLYVDGKYVFDITFNDIHSKKNNIRCDLKVDNKKVSTFYSVISEYDFKDFTIEEAFDIIWKFHLLYCVDIEIDDSYVINSQVIEAKGDTIYDIYEYIIDNEDEGLIVSKSMQDNIRTSINNFNYKKFQLIEEFEDNDSFLGKSYLFGKKISSLDFGECNVYIYKDVDYNLHPKNKNAIIFVEKDGTDNIEVYTLSTSLYQCTIERLKKLRFNFSVDIPYYYLNIDRVCSGNVASIDKGFSFLDIIAQNILDKHVRENIKDKEVELLIKSSKIDTSVDKCIKVLHDNKNKIRVNMEEAILVGFHSISEVILSVNGKVIQTRQADFIQKERFARAGGTFIAVNMYRDEKLESTFKELGIGTIISSKKC